MLHSLLFIHSVLFQNFYMQPTVVLKFRFIYATKYFVLSSGYKWMKNCTDWKLDKWWQQRWRWGPGLSAGISSFLFTLIFFFKSLTMQLTIACKFRFLYMQQKNLISVWAIRDKLLQTENWLNGLLFAYIHMICGRLLAILLLQKKKLFFTTFWLTN
jgi:drug/metabolite transporter (DMT)-like permease